MRSAAVLMLAAVLASCAHTGSANDPATDASQQSIVPLYVHTMQEYREYRNFLSLGSSYSMGLYIGCTATYIGPNLLVTHAACFRYNCQSLDNGDVTFYRTDTLLIGGQDGTTVQTVIPAYEKSLVFIRTSRTGRPLRLHQGPTLTGERLGKYAYRFRNTDFRGALAPAQLAATYPVSLDPGLFRNQPRVPMVQVIRTETRAGEMGGAVLNAHGELVGIVGGKLAGSRSALVPAQRIQEALDTYQP